MPGIDMEYVFDARDLPEEAPAAPVTRSSTFADAPGMRTATSLIGTMIWKPLLAWRRRIANAPREHRGDGMV